MYLEGSHGVVATNLAQGKVTKQSSNYSSDTEAGKAVDGNNDGRWNSGSVTRTKNDFQAWWEVDLSFEAEILSVKIYKPIGCCSNQTRFDRIFCCKNQLTNFYIKFYDYMHILVRVVKDKSRVGKEYTFEINPPVVARYVRVQQRRRSRRSYLSLAEVQVYGKVRKFKVFISCF